MRGSNIGMPFLDEFDGVEVGCGEMADIQIYLEVLGQRQSLRKAGGLANSSCLRRC
jgi:hypothetical protein